MIQDTAQMAGRTPHLFFVPSLNPEITLFCDKMGDVKCGFLWYPTCVYIDVVVEGFVAEDTEEEMWWI